jgi:hypothetical protein
MLRMKTRMTSKQPATLLEHLFNSHGCPTHWHMRAVKFISLGVLYQVRGGNRDTEGTEQLLRLLILKSRESVKHDRESRAVSGTIMTVLVRTSSNLPDTGFLVFAPSSRKCWDGSQLAVACFSYIKIKGHRIVFQSIKFAVIQQIQIGHFLPAMIHKTFYLT